MSIKPRLTKEQSRNCINKFFELTIIEYCRLNRQKSLDIEEQAEYNDIKMFLFGQRGAGNAMEVVFGKDVKKIRELIERKIEKETSLLKEK